MWIHRIIDKWPPGTKVMLNGAYSQLYGIIMYHTPIERTRKIIISSVSSERISVDIIIVPFEYLYPWTGA